MVAAVLKPRHTAKAELLVPIEPAVDGIRFARLEEAMAGNRVRRHASGNLQEGSTAFTNVGTRVVVAVMEEFLALVICQVECSTIGGH
jgi:hypothetical protein